MFCNILLDYHLSKSYLNYCAKFMRKFDILIGYLKRIILEYSIWLGRERFFDPKTLL